MAIQVSAGKQRDRFSAVDTDTRNPLLWPFQNDSPWNTSIGTGATYTSLGNGTTAPGGNTFTEWPGAELERIIMRPEAPARSVIGSSGGWGGDRCVADGTTISTTARIPNSYVLPSLGKNNATAILNSDGRTIQQFIAFARCTASGNATAWQEAFSTVDVFSSDGMYGSHGGSAMSALGGSLRLGELAAGSTIGPSHVLKFSADMARIGAVCTQTSSAYPAAGAGYRWPATRCDAGATNSSTGYGRIITGICHMGSLLAIPTSTSIASLGLLTNPAKALAWTLQNYGAYIVDDAAGPVTWIAVEDGPDGSYDSWFNSQHGFAFEARGNDNNDWTRDWGKIWQALALVTNNTVTNVGGGGTRLQPLAPAI